MRSIIANWFGRGRRIEARLAATEKTVSDILNEAKAIHAAISQAMKNKAAEIDAAVAKAKAAWEADDEADHAAALAELQAIRAELDNPPPFSPSAN